MLLCEFRSTYRFKMRIERLDGVPVGLAQTVHHLLVQLVPHHIGHLHTTDRLDYVHRLRAVQLQASS